MSGPGRRGTWYLVSGPDYHEQIPDELERDGGRLTWSAPSRLIVGALALFYRSSPSSDFARLFQACSDAVPQTACEAHGLVRNPSL